MKNFFNVVVGVLFTLGFYSTAISGTIGNPTATVEKGKTTAEINLDFTTKDMEAESEVEEVESNRILFKGTYGLSPIDIYVKFGLADAAVEDIEGDYGFAIGFGFKATASEMPSTRIGFGLQFLSFSSETTVDGADAGMDYNSEIELFGGASFLDYGNIIPYAGLFISMVDGEAWIEDWGSADFEQADDFGIFGGADFRLNDQLKAGAEIRIINETSFSLNLAYLF